MNFRNLPISVAVGKYEYFRYYVKNISNNKFIGELINNLQENNPMVKIIAIVENITEEDWNLIGLALLNYIEPNEALILHHTDDHFLNTIETNSQELLVLQSFIQSPHITDMASNKLNVPTVLNDIKIICCLRVNDNNVLSSWNQAIDPISIQFQIYDKTRNIIVSNQIIDISDTVLNLKNGAELKEFKTLQIYGVKDKIDTYSCIWQFKASISNPNIYLSINGVQKLYYEIEN